MNKRHLSVAVVAVLALSSSTIASAEGGSHRRMGEYNHIDSVAPIALSNSGGVLTIDTSTSTASFHFDTSTATSNVDDEPGISDDGEQGDDSQPAGLTMTVVPAGPNSPTTPGIPSWIKNPQVKSNDDNRDHSDHSSEDSQD